MATTKDTPFEEEGKRKETREELLARGYGRGFGKATVERDSAGKVGFSPGVVDEVTQHEADNITVETNNSRRIRTILQAHAVLDAALITASIPLEKRAELALRAIATFEGQKKVVEFDNRKSDMSANYDNLKRLKEQISNFEKYLDPKQRGEALAQAAAGSLFTLDTDREELN